MIIIKKRLKWYKVDFVTKKDILINWINELKKNYIK